MLVWHLTSVVKVVLEQARARAREIGVVFAEGGATAVALAQQMGWGRLRVIAELAPGVVAMSVGTTGISLVVKPGSYEWPESVAGAPLEARTPVRSMVGLQNVL